MSTGVHGLTWLPNYSTPGNSASLTVEFPCRQTSTPLEHLSMKCSLVAPLPVWRDFGKKNSHCISLRVDAQANRTRRGTLALVEDRDKRPTVDIICKHFHFVVGTSRIVPPDPWYRTVRLVTRPHPNIGDVSVSIPFTSRAPRQTSPRTTHPDFLFPPSSQGSTSIGQQAKFTADLTTGDDNADFP